MQIATRIYYDKHEIIHTMTVVYRTDTNDKLYWDEHNTSRKYTDIQIITGLVYALNLDKVIAKDRLTQIKDKLYWTHILEEYIPSRDTILKYFADEIGLDATATIDDISLYLKNGHRDELFNAHYYMDCYDKDVACIFYEHDNYYRIGYYHNYITLHYYPYDEELLQESNTMMHIVICTNRESYPS